MSSSQQFVIYTNGSSSSNPGSRGFALVFGTRGSIESVYVAEPQVSNNRMELMAAIEGLKALTQPSQVLFISDSKYLMNGASEWTSGRPTKAIEDLENADLWEQLFHVQASHKVIWKWTGGRSGNDSNQLGDDLANHPTTEQTRALAALPCAKKSNTSISEHGRCN